MTLLTVHIAGEKVDNYQKYYHVSCLVVMIGIAQLKVCWVFTLRSIMSSGGRRRRHRNQGDLQLSITVDKDNSQRIIKRCLYTKLTYNRTNINNIQGKTHSPSVKSSI